MMANVNKQYFLDLMRARKLSLRGLAAKLGMNHSQLSLTLNDKRRMQIDEAAALSQIFGVPLQEIAEAAGIDSRPSLGKRLCVLGYVGKDGSVTMNPEDVIERTDSPFVLPESAAAIQFRTADSPLSWMDSWLAFYVPRDTVAPDCIGRFCICQIKDGPTVVATMRRGYHDGSYNLHGPYQAENVELDCAAPLLFCRF